MTEEQIKQFSTSAEEYFHKQSKDGTSWKKEVYNFFEVINFYRKKTNKLQEQIEKMKCCENCKNWNKLCDKEFWCADLEHWKFTE